MTDVYSGWTDRRAMINRAAKWVIEALKEMEEAIFFDLKNLHEDNGSEFINMHLLEDTKDRIDFTRSRSGKTV